MGLPKPSGRSSLETLAGARVAGVLGALVGAIAAAIVGAGNAWLIFAGGAVGAAIGYWSEARRKDPS
jgi:hypothetical protein